MIQNGSLDGIYGKASSINLKVYIRDGKRRERYRGTTSDIPLMDAPEVVNSTKVYSQSINVNWILFQLS